MRSDAFSGQALFNVDIVHAVKSAAISRRLKSRGKPLNTPEESAESRIKNLSFESSFPIISARAVFPFAIFPDTINIDREKLTIIHTEFFRSSDVISLHIEDIQSVQSKVGPFFGTLTLSSKFFINSIQTVNFLKRSDAIKLQRFIQGSMIAHQKGIDCSKIDKNTLIPLLIGLGLGATA